jgi:hypothetical protein
MEAELQTNEEATNVSEEAFNLVQLSLVNKLVVLREENH